MSAILAAMAAHLAVRDAVGSFKDAAVVAAQAACSPADIAPAALSAAPAKSREADLLWLNTLILTTPCVDLAISS